MKTVLSATLKLTPGVEQFPVLRETHLACRNASNYVSRDAFEHGKMSNKGASQEATSHERRARYGMTGQMACSVPRQVGATYKSLWTRGKQNAQARRDKRTKKRSKGLDQAPKYVSPPRNCVYGHDSTFKKEQGGSSAPLHGRIKVSYQGYNKHLAYLREGATIGEAKGYYDTSHKQFYLMVSLEVEVADPTPEAHTDGAGVDVGVRYLATTADTRNTTNFYSGTRSVARAEHYSRLRKRLQRKGTR